ncbi:MAG: hypothetical protein QOG52_1250, partial [Frankiaceae bacterium]|nr:hypothetical protein [Frankiaceae bacterium]
MERNGEPADPYEEAGLPSTDNALPGKQITGDTQDEMVVPGDRPQAVNQWGTTALEESLGEPLDVRLSHEEPDVYAQLDEPASSEPDSDDPNPADRDERAGRIVDLDGSEGEDEESDMIARSAGTDGGGFSAEERAMH